MAKAILVMDMPESCSKCKFLYEFQGIKKCQLMNVLNGEELRLSQTTFAVKRYYRCPLLELPKKKRTIGNENETESLLMNMGWNACLDEITG